MMDTSFFMLLPVFLIAVFALLWIGVSALLSKLSGWSLLAERFKGAEPSTGKQFRFASGFIRRFRLLPVSYRNCLSVTLDSRGVHLGIFFIFRFLSPPLFIPWRAIESVGEQKHLFGKYGVVHIKDCPVVLLIAGEAGEQLRAEYAKLGGG
ncbi:MAG: hypothetical protein K9G39_05010 [Chlorobium sp.]|uniref:hypothetical protein n=1 Tax=Chlorobium sp. TaxID=1095 RepID=UPI0025BFA6DA|nr:hypothetical protein [Chlorobium sp.]MCF8382944.1 hypothetical protein [Chlorobium sp.]